MEVLAKPEHVSHSAIQSFLECGKKYELRRRIGKETPAWWFIGGSALHKATEWWDKGEWEGDPEHAFLLALDEEIAAAKEREPDEAKWLTDRFGKQNAVFWREQGQRYMANWMGMEIEWDFVELDVSTTLPSGIKIKAFIDRVARTALSTHKIVDLKSGSTKPTSDQQLGFYKVLFDLWLDTQKQGTPIVDGGLINTSIYMFKTHSFYNVDTYRWSLAIVDEMASDFLMAVGLQLFTPQRGEQCSRCPVAQACFLQSGDTELSRKYDSLHPANLE